MTVNFYEISEETARRAHESVHMSDYKPGSATEEYRNSVTEAATLAEKCKKRVSPFYHEKIDHLLDSYSRKLAEWYNDYNRNQASCPSWFISGPANYPVRKHERQQSRERSLWQEYDEIKGILEKIKSTGTGPIDLADPHAREMLTERLESLKNELERDKALNAHWRKYKTFKGFPGISDDKAAMMDEKANDTLTRCPWITKPCPDYELTSLRDKIKRTEERLAELDRRQEAQQNDDGTPDETFSGGVIVRNLAEDRLQIIFDEKPDEETRNKLKANGFRWSPKNTAWQRQLTDNAERALKALNLAPVQ